MSGPLLRRLWSWNAPRLLVVGLALFVWGYLMPVAYAAVIPEVRQFLNSGIVSPQFARLGEGLVSLPGALALGFAHPIFVALVGVFAIGLSATAVAGERQRGTLEVLLSRPLPRRRLWATHAVLLFALIAVSVATAALGMAVSSLQQGLLGELSAGGLLLTIVNGTLLYAAFASFGLAASVTFDRTGPAVGLSLGWAVLAYFLEIIGSLWPAASGLQPWSLFHYFEPAELLAGTVHPADFAVLVLAAAVPAVWALVVFPRRDIAAPS